ncbi:uncharacterized protein TNCV_4835221 [Trichonephila clavipes]|nr:uncharacterized protein TNCV_4835221 [Trichonephila clavipes]
MCKAVIHYCKRKFLRGIDVSEKAGKVSKMTNALRAIQISHAAENFENVFAAVRRNRLQIIAEPVGIFSTTSQWCAKIEDEVEKLAYQLNEEAERTERPIRGLSKVMYGSTCADMQVDVMGECLSSIKHVIGVR